jgi:hypothetical protein
MRGTSHDQSSSVQANSYDPQFVEQAMTELLAHLGGMFTYMRSKMK